jgi:hypothetical protein
MNSNCAGVSEVPMRWIDFIVLYIRSVLVPLSCLFQSLFSTGSQNKFVRERERESESERERERERERESKREREAP